MYALLGLKHLYFAQDEYFSLKKGWFTLFNELDRIICINVNNYIVFKLIFRLLMKPTMITRIE